MLPTIAELREIGRSAGLHALGVTHAEPFTEARVEIERRAAAGLDAGMQFTYRNPARSTTPSRIVDGARTLLVGALAYPWQRPEEPGLSAEIAAYAWRDHYGDLRQALEAVAQPLRDDGCVARVVADDNSLVDRAAAMRAGIGWQGKNGNVLLPDAGSWFVLGAVVTDAPYAPDAPIADGCGTCTTCFSGCPTDAIVADGVIDAARCLAWLLQTEGSFPVEFRAALGTRIYGCDDCQMVCPLSTEEFAARQGDEIVALDLVELLTCDDERLLELVGRWYIPRRDLRYVRRNALVALGNATVAEELRSEVVDVLGRYLGDDELLAEHARWTARRLGLTP